MKSRHALFGWWCLFLAASQPSLSQHTAPNDHHRWTDSFDLTRCHFATTGENAYCILAPSYRLEFRGSEGNDTTELVITVLDETTMVGGVETRIVEERESVNGALVEVSRNYFAFCTETNTVFYFGEDVDMFTKGTVTGHGGSWRAGALGARPGVMMPGLVLLGSRYYQESAPNVAMDRVEILSVSETLHTPAGNFANCLKTEETTPLEPKNKEYKMYAPGIGLVKDGDLLLVRHSTR